MNVIDAKIAANWDEWNGLMEYLSRCPDNMQKEIIETVSQLF